MNSNGANAKMTPNLLDWRASIGKYKNSELRQSVWQLVNSILPYLILWYLMYRSLAISYWLTLGLALLAGGFLVRIFIIFHDCGHGSFFRSKTANAIWGTITGILTFTPYHLWSHQHAIHHSASGDLDRRGVGDVWLVTVSEYQAMPRWKRAVYRFYRHPLVMFLLGPLFMFLIMHRFPGPVATAKDRQNLYLTNAVLAGILVLAHFTIGLKAYILIQLPVIWLAGIAGIWLFYLQHQFDGVYWRRHAAWDFESAALQGSSFYRLPKILQWFSGNIGFHHIHHLNARIPNYKLEKCYREIGSALGVQAITFKAGFKSLKLRLWDEVQGKLVGFGSLKTSKTV